MKKTIIFILVLGLIAVAYSFREKIVSEVVNMGTPKYAEYNEGTKCLTSPQFYTIKDPNKDFVAEAKSAFLKDTRISESYFDSNFTFDCAADAPNGKHVLFKYKIGDYSTDVHLIKFTGSAAFSITDYKNLHEIQNVLSKIEAENKLKQCLGGEPSNISIYLRNNALTMTGYRNRLTGAVDLETGECKVYDAFMSV